jgi:FKBP-type peptidyl-prolyl cis-trans isomerase
MVMRILMLPAAAAALFGLAYLVAGTPCVAQETKPAVAPVAPAAVSVPGLESQTQRVSYAIGLDLGGNFKAQEVPVDVDAFLAGLKDALAGKEPRLTQEQMQQTMMAFQQEMMAKQMSRIQKAAGDNTAKGDAFRAEQAKKDGIKSTATGLMYEVMQAGQGASPKSTDTVTVNYKGTLVDGTEFDSSYKRGEPATFQLDRVIPGWTEGLQLMNKGAKYRFIIPPDLAYGEQGAGKVIGPNATLVFEVELLDIKAGDAPASDAAKPDAAHSH